MDLKRVNIPSRTFHRVHRDEPPERLVSRFVGWRVPQARGNFWPPGISICAIHDGRIVWSRAFGLAYLEQPDKRVVVAVLVHSDYTFTNAIPCYA